MMQLLLLPWAADYEMKEIRLSVVDADNSSYSRQLISKITSSGYFIINDYSTSYKEAGNRIENDESDIILEIPANFEKYVVTENQATLLIAVNAINGVKANLGAAYLKSIIQDYNRELRLMWMQFPRFSAETTIEIISSNWYNPVMNYKYFMVPGILVILITIMGILLTSLNIVREKEIGTIEQINVSPVRKHYFILSKLIPFWIIGLVILTIGFIIARLLYRVIFAGDLIIVYVYAGVYLLAILGLGLLISTYTSSQQQAMLVSFFLMMIFILMGGIYTSIESMPVWAQYLTKLNPVTYFVEVIRMVILKGAGFTDITKHLLPILGFAVVFNGLAVLNYNKRN